MKKLISILLAGVMLLSLSAAAFAEGEAPDYATGTPWLCVDLDGNVTPDTPAELKDNFALYITKDAILMGMGSHFELWDKATYEKQEAEALQNLPPDALDNFAF